MNDKTECIFLNSKSVKKAEDKELAAFLAYVNGKAAATAFTKKLDKEATRIKNREEWRLKIMTLDMEIEMMKRRTAEKAKQEGKQEGKLEERKAVAMEMIKNGEPLEKILQYSKLTEAAIRKLAKSMGAAVL